MTASRTALLLVVAVFAACVLNHGLGLPTGSSAWAFWLPNGVALAFLLRRPSREWPWLLAGLLLGEASASLLLTGTLWNAIRMHGLASVLEVLLAGGIMRKVAPRSVEIPSVARILAFTGVVTVAPLLPSALAAAFWVQTAGGDFLPLARTFYVGDSLGLLIATPLILTWWHPPDLPQLPSKGGRWEGTALGISAVALGVAIFAVPPEVIGIKPLPYLVMPLLMWGASRFGFRGGTFQVAAIALIAVGFTARGFGHFHGVSEDPNLRVAHLQLFLSVISVSTLLLASIEGQHARLEAEKQRGETLAALGELAARVAHDFNNDLTVIAAWADLSAGRDDAAERSEASAGILHAVDRSTALVGQLVAFGSKDAEKPSLVVPAELLEPLAPMLRRTLGAGHELRLELPEEPWPVRASPHQLEVALINLAANGRDAMTEGGTLTVGARNCQRSSAASERVAFFVRDEGQGIAPDELHRIYEPFYTTKAGRGGTGLGLTTVRRVVERFGGTVHADSTLGEGTTFEIILPRADRSSPVT